MISKEEYRKKMDNISKKMSNHLIDVCQTVGIRPEIFNAFLLAELYPKKDNSTKDILKDGVPRRYLSKEFKKFINSVQRAMNKCISDGPSPKKCERTWKDIKSGALFGLLKYFHQARQLEFVANKVIDPCEHPNVLLLNFTYGSFPEEYEDYPNVINGKQANLMRKLLFPHITIFLKAVKANDEFSIYSAYLVGFCIGVWPEYTTSEVVLDYPHMEKLRFALRQHSEFLFDKFCKALPETPPLPAIPGVDPKVQKLAVELALDTFPEF